VPTPGDFFLLRGTDPVGRLIEFGELLYGEGFGEFSHAGIMVNATQILEAEPGGARLRPVDEYGSAMVWSSWKLDNIARLQLSHTAMTYLGVGYSAMDYFALAAHHWGLPLPGLKSYVASSGHMICSQLVDQIYTAAGFPMFHDGRWPGFVTPQSLKAVLAGPA
jgi:hypothetical protein